MELQMFLLVSSFFWIFFVALLILLLQKVGCLELNWMDRNIRWHCNKKKQLFNDKCKSECYSPNREALSNPDQFPFVHQFFVSAHEGRRFHSVHPRSVIILTIILTKDTLLCDKCLIPYSRTDVSQFWRNHSNEFGEFPA